MAPDQSTDPVEEGCDSNHDLPSSAVNSSSEESGLSRRGFLKGAGLSVASASLISTMPAAIAAANEKADEGKLRVLTDKSHNIQFELNGKATQAAVIPSMTALELFRDKLDHTGAKEVCDRGSCGACTLLVDGLTVNSCSMLAVDLQGKKVTSVEGLAQGDKIHPVQQAFIEADAAQCGFCTPGMVLACVSLLDKNPKPSREQTREALAGNLCRCGTYQNIFDAVDICSGKKGGSPKTERRKL